jgi:hypothetical protein
MGLRRKERLVSLPLKSKEGEEEERRRREEEEEKEKRGETE